MIKAAADNPNKEEKGHSADGAMKLQNNLVKVFEELEMRETEYSIQYFPKDSSIEIKAQVPRGRPMERVIWELSGAAQPTPFSAEDCVCANEANCTVTFKSSSAKHPKVILHVRQAGRYFSNTAKMAILIEDFGFEADQSTAEYLSFPEPLTVALVPAQKLAQWTARIADEYKKEIVLLLPMEAMPPQFDKYKKSMVMLHHNEAEIRGLIAQAAAAVPNFSGVCNFYGSRVMEDSRAMEIILSEVNRRKGYFVYTNISRKPAAPQLAKSMKVPSYPVQRSIDANLTAEQVRERMTQYSMEAQKTGKILIKAQPSPTFIKVLKEETETLRNNGIRLVYVSELIK
jgi:polysaccharide deacetylase 2 family uncharacterized protein YibQ